MPDEIAEQLDLLRNAIRSHAAGPKGGAESVAAFRGLAESHPLCVEVAFANAVMDFFSYGLKAGMQRISGVLADIDKYYSVSCFDVLQATSLRTLVGDRVGLAPKEYIEFLFAAYFVREIFAKDEFFYSWIDSEWKKRALKRQYNELYQLRNMVWSLTRGLVGKAKHNDILAKVDLMDSAIVDLLRSKLGSRERKKRNAVINNIAICCGLLKHDYRSLHAALVFDYARNLVKSYPDVTVSIVVTNEMPFQWVGHKFWMGQISDSFREGLRAEADRLIEPELRSRVRFVDMPLGNGSWQDLWQPIKYLLDLDPDVLMFYGAKFYNESWFVRKALFDHYPTVYFFSQMNNVVDQQNDIYLVRNNYRLSGAYDPSRTLLAPPAVRADILTGKKGPAIEYSAADVKQSPGEVTIVTALAGTRMATLFSRYSPSTRKQMMSLLDIPGVRWIWVGPADPSEVLKVDALFREKHAEGKLEIRKFEPHLDALFGKCDLMLHLPRFTGGGGGLMLALRAELPVLCFNNTDSSAYVLPECVFDSGDEAAYFSCAENFIRSPELLPELGERAAAHYAKYDVEGLARLTYGGLQKAVGFFNDRVVVSASKGS